MIYCILGASGVGKTTISEKIFSSTDVSRIPQVTTRDIRPLEKSGYPYIFTTDERFNQYSVDGYLMEKRSYTIANNKIVKYGTMDIFGGKLKYLPYTYDYLIVTSEQQFKSIYTKFKDCVIPIVIYISDRVRLQRLLLRIKTDEELPEMIRRFTDDTEDGVKQFHKLIPDFSIDNSEEETTSVVSSICDRIELMKITGNWASFKDDEKLISGSDLADMDFLKLLHIS